MLRIGDTVKVRAPSSYSSFGRYNKGTIVSLSVPNGVNNCNRYCGENVNCCKVANSKNREDHQCFWTRDVELVKANEFNV